tara:strand:- start:153 stop:1127 length:975 start_codon:yes stop_codon:yes gene_type:complete
MNTKNRIIDYPHAKITKKSTLFSVLKQGFQLATEGYKHKSKKYRRKQQWKILFHSLCNPRFSAEWFDLLSSVNYSYIFSVRPRLYIKPFRTYISVKWNKHKKLKVIFDSYRLMRSENNLFSKLLYENKRNELALLPIGDDYSASLILGYDDQFRKEGEIILSLECDGLGGRVVSVAFSFEEIEEGRWVCWVGCVQGHALKMHQATKLIQKLMHGLRPNSFIVVALQDLCRNLGCDAIYCVADSAHSYRKKHAVHLPWRHKIDFDYDEFWQDIGAKKVDQHWFELPLVRARKEMSELKTKKRAMYRKRYTMLDEVAINISNAVNR